MVEAAVNLELFRPEPENGKEIREKLDLNGYHVVGYIGAFLTWHGVDDLLHAARLVIESLGNTKFLLVGPATKGITDAIRKEGLEESVILTGPIAYRKVPNYINACDVLVAPYNTRGSERGEVGIGSPLKVLEYMACGKPAVGSDLPQVARIIEDGSTGLLFPPGDEKELAFAITRLLTDAGLREKVSTNGYELVRSKYSWEALARKIHGMMNEAILEHACS
jgi:glycosyltransferase involved in cell wall biosynthesis